MYIIDTIYIHMYKYVWTCTICCKRDMHSTCFAPAVEHGRKYLFVLSHVPSCGVSESGRTHLSGSSCCKSLGNNLSGRTQQVRFHLACVVGPFSKLNCLPIQPGGKKSSLFDSKNIPTAMRMWPSWAWIVSIVIWLSESCKPASLFDPTVRHRELLQRNADAVAHKVRYLKSMDAGVGYAFATGEHDFWELGIFFGLLVVSHASMSHDIACLHIRLHLDVVKPGEEGPWLHDLYSSTFVCINAKEAAPHKYYIEKWLVEPHLCKWDKPTNLWGHASNWQAVCWWGLFDALSDPFDSLSPHLAQSHVGISKTSGPIQPLGLQLWEVDELSLTPIVGGLDNIISILYCSQLRSMVNRWSGFNISTSANWGPHWTSKLPPKRIQKVSSGMWSELTVLFRMDMLCKWGALLHIFRLAVKLDGWLSLAKALPRW